jgi:predicted GIY-YIG superfamily endonuclease
LGAARERFKTNEIHPTMSRAFVYLIQAEGGLCKIGVSKDPWKRLGMLQTGNGAKLLLRFSITVPDACALEADLHNLYKEWRREGEWFDLGEGDIEVIRQLCRMESNKSLNEQHCQSCWPDFLKPQMLECCGNADAPPWILQCPFCGNANQHVERWHEDGLEVNGECGHCWFIRFRTHKGETLISIDHGDEESA